MLDLIRVKDEIGAQNSSEEAPKLEKELQKDVADEDFTTIITSIKVPMVTIDPTDVNEAT